MSCSYTEIKTLTLKSIAIVKIFMQMKNNRFNRVVIKIWALIFAKERCEKQWVSFLLKEQRQIAFLFYKKLLLWRLKCICEKELILRNSLFRICFCRNVLNSSKWILFSSKKLRLFILWWLLFRQIDLTCRKEKGIIQCSNKNETLLCWNVSIISILSYY